MIPQSFSTKHVGSLVMVILYVDEDMPMQHEFVLCYRALFAYKYMEH